MLKHEDGSVTLTKEEFAELNLAYQNLYTIISDMPVSLKDFFEDHEEAMTIWKWRYQLQGKPFKRQDWE